MSVKRHLIHAVAAFLATSAMFAPSGAHSQTTGQGALIVQTDAGAVQGAVAHGVENFLDIPYAAPPVGPLRWQPPQPAAAWTGIRAAAAYGHYCTQPQNFDSPTGPALNEDCLDVNVQRPVGTWANEKLPVYVYIHGGGFVTGSGVKDGQDKIVRLNGIVGVTMSYRLGAMGFLALPSLASGSHETGDYGLLDQQAALRWVQRNIARFGGDPQKVTIGGESAGGWSVCTHLVAPGSRGLFARAIVESGACVSVPLAQAEAGGEAFAAKLGCTTPATQAACLCAKPVSAILAAQAPVYFPKRDTPFLPLDTWHAIQAGNFAHVPVIAGSNRDEGRSFTHADMGWSKDQYEAFLKASFGSRAGSVLKLYPYPEGDHDPAAVAYQVAAINTDDGTLVGQGVVNAEIGGCGDLAMTEALARYVPVYAYEFTHRTGPGWFPTPGYLWGAGHAAELPYLYPQHDAGKTYAGFTPAEVALSDEMVRYWGKFSERADPNGAGLPHWPAYSTGQFLSLDVDGKTVAITKAAFANEHRCSFWDRLTGTVIK
jgi:carboxylesterase type B